MFVIFNMQKEKEKHKICWHDYCIVHTQNFTLPSSTGSLVATIKQKDK
jgi:hypothetical protein